MKNLLITGGAGFIGSNLAIELNKLGYRVTVLDNLSPQIHGEDYHKSSLFNNIKGIATFIRGDVTSRQDWEKAIVNQEIIVHLAAETGTGQSMYEIERYNHINVTGTAILWDILANTKHNIQKVVVASSRAIYGEGKYRCKEHGIVYPLSRLEKDMSKGDFNVKCPVCRSNVEIFATDENSKIHPTSVYGFTKQAQEELSMIAGKSLNIPVVAFRYQNVYGPGQSLTNPYTGILSIFSTRIRNGNDVNIFEDGKESRDFVFIDDVVNATIMGIQNPEANYQSFNVGTGVRTDVLTVAQTLQKMYHSDVKIQVTGNYRLGDIRDNFADVSKIKKMLGFQYKTNFNEGIQQFVNWVLTQEKVSDNYDSSIQEMKKKGLYK